MGLCKRGVQVIVVLLFLLPFSKIYAQPAGYSYAKEITIQSSQIAGTLTNFPVLVSFTDADLKTVGNGGHVQNANGWDIVFTLTDCTTILDEQIESYDAATGTVLIWVKIPSLPSGSNFNFFMFYGNNTVASNPSTTATWDANYVSIWHLDENPGSGTYADISANAQNGTTHNMVAADQVTGIIGKAGNFNGSNKYVSMGGGPPWPASNAVKTLSVWARYTSTPSGNQNFLSFTHSSISSAYQIGFRGNVPLAWDWGGGALAADPATPSSNAWHYYVYTYDGTNNNFYVDGTLVKTTTTGTQSGVPDQGSIGVYMTTGGGVGGEYFKGYLDEGRLSKTNRSANWIKTEYNNQSSPATFYTESTEYSASVICSVLPIRLLYFTGQAYNSYNILSWSTETEVNNKYFTVERTTDELNWSVVGTVNGAGNSTRVIDYSLNDDYPAAGVNYYRLKQTDFDGNYTYSNVIAISSQVNDAIKVYPNPTHDDLNITITANTYAPCTVQVFNSTGQQICNLLAQSNSSLKVNMSSYPAGIYCIVVNSNNKLYKNMVVKY